jgi:hypothetical protein
VADASDLVVVIGLLAVLGVVEALLLHGRRRPQSDDRLERIGDDGGTAHREDVPAMPKA